jgi:hypothetical protein
MNAENNKSKNILRWALLIPAVIVAWYVIFAFALFSHQQLEKYLCPPQDWVSGFCHNTYVLKVLNGYEHFMVAISAFVVVFVATKMAPNKKRWVLFISYLIGAIVALLMAFIVRDGSQFFAAIIGGAIGVALVWRLLQTRHNPND